MWTCVYALLPLVLSIGLTGRTDNVPRELLYFALTMGTLSLATLRDADARSRKGRWYDTLFQFSVFTVVLAAALYGAIASHSTELFGGLLRVAPGALALIGFSIATTVHHYIEYRG